LIAHQEVESSSLSGGDSIFFFTYLFACTPGDLDLSTGFPFSRVNAMFFTIFCRQLNQHASDELFTCIIVADPYPCVAWEFIFCFDGSFVYSQLIN
jgi:hypothetical protein